VSLFSFLLLFYRVVVYLLTDSGVVAGVGWNYVCSWIRILLMIVKLLIWGDMGFVFGGVYDMGWGYSIFIFATCER